MPKRGKTSYSPRLRHRMRLEEERKQENTKKRKKGKRFKTVKELLDSEN